MSGRERRAAKPPRSVSKMQSAVTNGAASRAHRILDAAISAGLAPEGNLAIAERGKGRRNRPYKSGSTVAPFVTAIYNSIKPQFGCRASGTVRNPLTHYTGLAQNAHIHVHCSLVPFLGVALSPSARHVACLTKSLHFTSTPCQISPGASTVRAASERSCAVP